jgi:hypothetical protein
MRRISGSLWLAAVLGLVACDEDSEQPEGRGDAGAMRDGARPELDADTDASAIVDAGLDAAFDATLPDAEAAADGAAPDDARVREAGLGRQPPTNVSFETAKRLEPDTKPPLQDVLAADQIDYYVFAGKAGEFYEISTDRGSFSPDMVVTLYDAEHTPLAQNDDGSIWPGDDFDSRLVYRAPADGEYYIAIEDRYTPASFFESDFALLFYHPRVRALRAGVPGVALAQGSEPSAVSFAHDVGTDYQYVTLLGELGEDPGTFDFTGSASRALIGRALTAGGEGNGSSAAGGVVEVLDADQQVVAHIDRSSGQVSIDPPIEAVPYRMLVKAGGELGANPFYALDVVVLPDNPREQSEADNGVLAGAEALALEGMFSRRGLVLVTLPENDVDYFKIDALAMESILVVCEGESGGSGVRGLTAEVRDDTDQPIASASETSIANLQIERTQVTRAGTYYLRLSSTTPAAAADSIVPWTRCALMVGR